MTDRPIIFSGSMVRALLDGHKTQTRRLASSPLAKCQPGDRLWVRESFAHYYEADDDRTLVSEPMTCYRATGYPLDGYLDPDTDLMRDEPPWRPSIHMPRYVSRLTLVVQEVRRQRLQEIGLEDVLAEGAPIDPDYRDATRDQSSPPMVKIDAAQWCTPRAWFHRLWDALHGSGAWETNPEVVTLIFEVHRCNIDRMPVRERADA